MRRRMRFAVLAVAMTTFVSTVVVPAATAKADPVDRGDERMRVLTVYRAGGPAVREAAATALVGTDADIKAFLDNGWDRAAQSDERARVADMLDNGGVTVKQAAQNALNAGNAAAVTDFLKTGWVPANQQDLRIRVNQMMAVGGQHLREAGQAVLDAATEDGYRAFLDEGWRTPQTADLRIRVNQLMAAGGQKVRLKAQEALDAGTVEAFEQFLDYEWPTAQARDQETASIAELARVAKVAGDLAAAETQAAKDASEQAVTEALLAKEAAEKARQATESAGRNAAEAAKAAALAADAANRAARAAAEAISAANAASTAARVAAGAASRAATAAAMAGQAASRAYDAATATAMDAANVPWARDSAVAARQAAADAGSIAEAITKALEALDYATTAARSAARAAEGVADAAAAATQAGDLANQAGADAAIARNAAAAARNQAARASRAAQAATDLAATAAQAARNSRDAANRAAADAIKAADSAEAAILHAGNAQMAAAESAKHANAATNAANTALEAAAQARTIYDAARAAEAAKLEIRADQATEAAQQAKTAIAGVQASQKFDADQASLRDAETNRLIAEASAPGANDAIVTANGRKIAMRLSEYKGPWTKEAAVGALVSSDDEVRAYVRTGIARAAGRDDRVTLTSMSKAGSQSLKDVAAAKLAGSDADVRAFLLNPVYPSRDTEARIKVNQLLAAAQAANRPTTVTMAQKALDAGTGAAFRTFLDKDRFSAGVVDDRVQVNRVIADPATGAETKAMAQAVLNGPPTSIQHWLETGRLVSVKRDQETAAHVAEMQGYLAMAAGAAATATKNANEAQSAAAVARNAANEASAYAQEAQRNAAAAATFAQEAKDSASAAERSAQDAANSARVARNASAQAQASAHDAMRSATWAEASAKEAAGFAAAAYGAYREAYDIATAAGKQADEARAAADAALTDADRRISDSLVQKLHLQAENCRALTGAEHENCMNLLSQNEYDTVSRVYMNGEACWTLYGHLQDSSTFHNCTADAMSTDFAEHRNLQLALELVDTLTMILGGAALAGTAVLVGAAAWEVLAACWGFCSMFLNAVDPIAAAFFPGMVMTATASVGVAGVRIAGIINDLRSRVTSSVNSVAESVTIAARLVEHERRLLLGVDTAKNKFSIDEMKIALWLEDHYQIQLMRWPHNYPGKKNPDWFDASGRTYDAVGPVGTQFFDAQWASGAFQASIKKHVEGGIDIVPIDVYGLTPAQAKQVRDHVSQTYDPSKVFVIETTR